MRVIIAGGRDFTDYPKLRDTCDKILSTVKVTHILSGRNGTTVNGVAKSGADAMGEQYASERGYLVKLFPYPADKGKAGGPIRNGQMVAEADALIAFDTGGPGTADVIKQAEGKGLKVRVVNCKL